MQTRKAASVLPEPVGAAISVWRPAAISRQPLGLRLGRPVRKAALEPAAHGGMERLEHALTLPGGSDIPPVTSTFRAQWPREHPPMPVRPPHPAA